MMADKATKEGSAPSCGPTEEPSTQLRTAQRCGSVLVCLLLGALLGIFTWCLIANVFDVSLHNESNGESFGDIAEVSLLRAVIYDASTLRTRPKQLTTIPITQWKRAGHSFATGGSLARYTSSFSGCIAMVVINCLIIAAMLVF